MMNLPAFESEAEEARWWFEHQEDIEKEFVAAAAEGRMERGSLARSAGLTPTTPIRLDPADIALAREQAEKRGHKYQTYLKMLIHEALRRPEPSAS